LLDQLNQQLLRIRQLLDGDTDQAAEGVLAPLGAYAEAEARIAVELASVAPLAEPNRFSKRTV